MTKKLKVVYTGELDKNLDKAITKMAEDLGWKFQGSGYLFDRQERDLSFIFEENNN